MGTKFFSALGIALVAIALMTIGVGAEQGSGGGTGTLTAHGDGYAAMSGGGWIVLTGSGVLKIQDLAGDIQIDIEGKGKRQEFGDRIVYAGFDGKARIRGTKFNVSLAGKNIRLIAEGTGKFLLRGHGNYHTQHDRGVWTTEGKVITLP